MFRLTVIIGLFVAVLIAFSPAVMAAGQITITGRAEVVYNKGNGLNHYYIQTGQQKYRVWTHILDPDQDIKEKMLEDAAKTGAILTLTGEISGSGKDAKILINKLKREK